MQLSVEQIKAIIPHRFPFLLIDKVLDYVPGKWAKAIKCVSADEPFFAGHFPDYPIMPGVLIIEALAQTGAVAILTEPENAGKLAFLAAINNVRFKRQVSPGDVLSLETSLSRRFANFGSASASAFVGDDLACSLDFSFAIAQS